MPRIPWHKHKMKILATADLHGYLPRIPKCDLLLIGGDVCPLQIDHEIDASRIWLDITFRNWLNEIPAKHIIGIAGNHDFVFEAEDIHGLRLPWCYLLDNTVTIDSVTIHGTPWVPNLPNWAFHQTKEQLAQTYNMVPKEADIVLSHGPPNQYGDRLIERHRKASEGYNPHCGAKAATDMLARVKPKAFVCGHIHEGFGQYRFKQRDESITDIYNVSYVDEDYNPRGDIIEINIDNAEDQTDG